MTIATAIHGAAGRMGQRLIALGNDDAELTISEAIDNPDHPSYGKDAGTVAGVGELGVAIDSQLSDKSQVVIDFSVPTAVPDILRKSIDLKIPIVVATTGLDKTQESLIQMAAEVIPVVWAPNMSLAVNIAMKLTSVTAAALASHSSGVDVEILERHHRYKEDSPSGTALKFGETIAAIMGQTNQVHGREGRPGVRPRDEIAYHAIRTGDNPGEHTIVFGMLGETIEVTVRASNRDCYALGALTAAKFATKQSPGLYSMFDVLGLT
ncbi:MAG: 4-hydroxy-tetrahydrodipicolinate reductase [Planctomycetota bacterium]